MDKAYEKVAIIRRAAKNDFSSSPSLANKQKLKEANVELMGVYNALKSKYYEKLIANLGDDAREFYSLMRTKRCSKASLPIIMTYNGVSYSGDARYEMICNHLSSCFTKSENEFPQDADEFDLFLSHIHRTNYSNEHEQIWNNYINVYVG